MTELYRNFKTVILINCNSLFQHFVVNAKALSIMHCQDDINTEHNMKSIGRAAVAQWTKRLTRNGQTRVRIREAHIFDITISYAFNI